MWANNHFPGRLRLEKSPFHCLHNDEKEGVLELGRPRPDLRFWWDVKLEAKATADCKSCSTLKTAPEDEPGPKPQPPAGPADLGKHALPLDASEQRALTPRCRRRPRPPHHARGTAGVESARPAAVLYLPAGRALKAAARRLCGGSGLARRKFRSPRHWVGGGG